MRGAFDNLLPKDRQKCNLENEENFGAESLDSRFIEFILFVIKVNSIVSEVTCEGFLFYFEFNVIFRFKFIYY